MGAHLSGYGWLDADTGIMVTCCGDAFTVKKEEKFLYTYNIYKSINQNKVCPGGRGNPVSPNTQQAKNVV